MIRYLDFEVDIFEELTELSESEMCILSDKLKNDDRINTIVSEGCGFYKEEDEEQLKEDYPLLKDIFNRADSLEDYIQWEYGNEDIYIESDNYNFRIKADDIANEIKSIVSLDYTDDYLFENLKEELNKAVVNAQTTLVELSLFNLIGELEQYTEEKGFKIKIGI